MKIIHCNLFQKYPEIIFGFSTKIGLNRTEPYYFNMSYSVGDYKKNVDENRSEFFRILGLDSSKIAYQKQIHSDIVNIVNEPGFVGFSDAMITNKTNIGLAISSADCVPIFLYDKNKKVVAAVHSGWRGTHKKILYKTLQILLHEFNSEPKNLFVYIGPSISQKNYQVGQEVAELFDKKYLHEKNSQIYLDIKTANVDILLSFGILEKQIEVSNLCTFEEKELLFSFRRDGSLSGRSLGVIAIKDKS